MDDRMLEYERRHRKLADQLSKIGFLWYGSIRRSRMTCGTPTCACHTDPHALHGPYIYWTAKKGGKSVAKLLKFEEAVVYTEWIGNRRRLDRIVRQMINLSRRALKTAVRLRLPSTN